MNATSNTLQSLTRCSEKNTGNQGNFNFISVREPHAAINHESNVNVRSVCQSKNAPMVNLKTNQADVQSIDQKWCGVNGTVAYDQNEEEYVICNPPNSHDSNSTGGVVSDTDSRSSEGSVKFSPSQVYQAPVYQRKSGDELSEIGNAHQGGGGDCSENLMREISETKREYKKWQCLYCMKSFLCRSALENHERTHTGEKPFQCTDCGRCFSHQGNLKQHLHIHRDVKPHICDICGKGFTRSNRLRDHKLAHEVSSDKNIEWTPVTLHTSSSWPLRTSEPNGYTTNSKTTIYKDFQKSSPPRE